MDEPAILARGLVKRYGDLTAVNEVDVTVPRGSVLGVLGPNGAGKTTTVKMLTTLLRPDAGTVRVAGVDVLADPSEAKRRIGVSGQYAAVDEYLTGFENLYLVGRLYHLSRKEAKQRAHELLEQFSLTGAANRQSKTYSGGMRRRLDLAGALVVRPPVIFLDEPTTGLDPRARGDMWAVIRDLVAAGTTLLLTTQYLDEADALADSIMVIDSGKVIAEGTAAQLKAAVGGEQLEVTVADATQLSEAARIVAGVGQGEVHAEPERASVSVPVADGVPQLRAALDALEDAAICVTDVGLRRPTLDDVFLTLTSADTRAGEHVPDLEPHNPTEAGE